jgi:hypothetical protein
VKRRGMLVAGALALAVAAAGCGGGSEDETPLTKAEFTKQADAICATTKKAVKTRVSEAYKEIAKNAGSTAEKAQEEFVLAVMPTYRTMSDELNGLAAPSGDEEQVKAIVSGYDSTISEYEEKPSAAIAAGGEPFAKTSTLAAKYGLKECAKI